MDVNKMMMMMMILGANMASERKCEKLDKI